MWNSMHTHWRIHSLHTSTCSWCVSCSNSIDVLQKSVCMCTGVYHAAIYTHRYADIMHVHMQVDGGLLLQWQCWYPTDMCSMYMYTQVYMCTFSHTVCMGDCDTVTEFVPYRRLAVYTHLQVCIVQLYTHTLSCKFACTFLTCRCLMDCSNPLQLSTCMAKPSKGTH